MSTFKNQKSKERSFYHCVTVLAMYHKEEKDRQRHLNVMVQTPAKKITQQTLQQVNRATMERVEKENGVTPDMMRDIVIMNISCLGGMTHQEFANIESGARADH